MALSDELEVLMGSIDQLCLEFHAGQAGKHILSTRRTVVAFRGHYLDTHIITRVALYTNACIANQETRPLDGLVSFKVAMWTSSAIVSIVVVQYASPVTSLDSR